MFWEYFCIIVSLHHSHKKRTVSCDYDCMHIFSYYEVMFCTKRGLQVGNKHHFRSTYGHKANSELTLGRRLSYYAFRRRGFSNVTINELKNVLESEIQGPASMRGCRGLWHSLKTNKFKEILQLIF